jgi:methylated-DNA-[protein]-cysteine S-methyltransferase
MTTYHDVIETRFGWMGLLRSETGLMRTTLPQPSPDRCIPLLGAELDGSEHAPDRFTALAESLGRYFEGGKHSFADEPLDLEDATPFHRMAWLACMSIPFGETRTYKWLATRAGKPKAPRAAGQSMARNRLPIVVPCHRVIAADGGLRGFGAGATQLDLKQSLLTMEADANWAAAVPASV